MKGKRKREIGRERVIEEGARYRKGERERDRKEGRVPKRRRGRKRK